MPKIDPAFRLKQHLDKTFEYEDSIKLERVWKESSIDKSFEGILEHQRLIIIEARKSLVLLERMEQLRDPQIYAPVLNKIISGYTTLSFVHNVRQLKDKIGEYSTGLTILSDMFISYGVSEEYIESIKIESILETIGDLIKQVKSSDIDPEVQSKTLNLLCTLQIGLNQYEISGVSAFKDSVEKTLGVLILNQDIKEQLNHNKTTNTVFNQIFALIEKMNQIFQFAQNTPLLIEATRKIFVE